MGTEMGTGMGMGMSYDDDDDEIEGHHPQTPQPEALAVPRLGGVSLSQHCHSTLYIVHFIHRGHGVRSTTHDTRHTTGIWSESPTDWHFEAEKKKSSCSQVK